MITWEDKPQFVIDALDKAISDPDRKESAQHVYDMLNHGDKEQMSLHEQLAYAQTKIVNLQMVLDYVTCSLKEIIEQSIIHDCKSIQSHANGALNVIEMIKFLYKETAKEQRERLGFEAPKYGTIADEIGMKPRK